MSREADSQETGWLARNADAWNYKHIILGNEQFACVIVAAHDLNSKAGEELYRVQTASGMDGDKYKDLDERSWGSPATPVRVRRTDGSKDMVAFEEAYCRHRDALEPLLDGENNIQRMLWNRGWLYMDDHLNQPPERQGLRQALVEILSYIESHQAIPEALGAMVVSRLMPMTGSE